MSNQIQEQNILNAKHTFSGFYYSFSNVIVDERQSKLYFIHFILDELCTLEQSKMFSFVLQPEPKVS
jgi:hypothetical protein